MNFCFSTGISGFVALMRTSIKSSSTVFKCATFRTALSFDYLDDLAADFCHGGKALVSSFLCLILFRMPFLFSVLLTAMSSLVMTSFKGAVTLAFSTFSTFVRSFFAFLLYFSPPPSDVVPCCSAYTAVVFPISSKFIFS